MLNDVRLAAGKPTLGFLNLFLVGGVWVGCMAGGMQGGWEVGRYWGRGLVMNEMFFYLLVFTHRLVA